MQRIEKLRQLEQQLADAMETASSRSLPALAKQYRETIREIDEIEGGGEPDDEIGAILSARKADGKPNSVGKNRTKAKNDRRR